MKYIVSDSAVFSFPDGTKFEITAGIHDSFPDKVKAHWAFSAYAAPLDDAEAARVAAANEDLSLRVSTLESDNAALLVQLAAKDEKITSLKAQLASVPDSNAPEEKQEATSAKKQSSANK